MSHRVLVKTEFFKLEKYIFVKFDESTEESILEYSYEEAKQKSNAKIKDDFFKKMEVMGVFQVDSYYDGFREEVIYSHNGKVVTTTVWLD